ncbi:hypothetical protein [Shewanella marisflavi]|uniref:hypothetical protein n=1 Tax=Shewanella TaxID=22 RepID=UPI003AAD73F9
MKKALLSLTLVALSTSVFAQDVDRLETKQLAHDMEQLVTVTEEAELFVTIDEEASFESVKYQGFITEKFSEIYVTREQAKAHKLEKTRKFYVYGKYAYGEKDIANLEHKIVQRIEQDKPLFFSVDLYRDYHGDSGEFNYVARVIEYK